MASGAPRSRPSGASPTSREPADLVGGGADFVGVCVPGSQTPELTVRAVELGLRVLAETPPAPTADGLRELWAAVGSTGLVRVAEQYLLMPGHAARLALVQTGALGKITSVQVSSTHLYH